MTPPDDAIFASLDTVGGWTVPTMAALIDALAGLALDDPGYSAQVSLYQAGRPVADLWTGPDLHEDSLICVFSASKGISGLCLGLLVERGQLVLEAPVREIWPEFGVAGKGGLTIGDLLAHRAGLPEVDDGLTWDELRDDTRAATRLAAQRPFWTPGSAWGYHALTLGALMNELCRRSSGRTLQEFFEHEVRAPRGIDAYLGLPADLEHRVADVIVPDLALAPVLAPQLQDHMGRLLADLGFDFLANSRESHAAGLPAAGGVASARGLARLYAAVGDDLGGGRLMSDVTVAEMGRIRSDGADLLSGLPGRFGAVFQKPFPGRPFASHRAIGHDGAAGALGFYDPTDGIAFGYVTNTPAPPGGDRRADALADVARRALAS